jgi:hypothetical protein
MPQFARPSADTTLGAWSDQIGGVINIFQAIDEEVLDDADFIVSEDAPAASVYVTKLTTVEDPVIDTGHVLRVRFQKDLAGGSQIDCDVELREGYVSEISLGTLIATRTFADVANGWTTEVIALTEGEVVLITDYTNLYLRIIADQV